MTLPKPKTLGAVGFLQKSNNSAVHLQCKDRNVEGGSRPSPTAENTMNNNLSQQKRNGVCRSLYFCIREILLHKVHLVNTEGLTVEVLQTLCIGGEGEGQLVRIQSLVIPVKILIELAVFAVA